MWQQPIGPAALLLALVGCGGDSTAPSEPFPAVAGVYQVDGGFDGLTRQEASFSGTMTLSQASRQSGTLTGTEVITGQIGGQVYDLSGGSVQTASVTPAGAVTVVLLSSTGAVTWTFTGNHSGNLITGRHTLASSTQSISGDWTGNLTGAAVQAVRRRTPPAVGGWEMVVGALEGIEKGER